MSATECGRTFDELQRTVQGHTEALVEQFQLMHEILASLPLGLIRVDAAWNVDYANPEAERILGRSRAELAGPIYRSALLEPFFEALKQASDEGRWGFPQPLEIVHEAGHTARVYARVVLLRPAAELFQGAVVLVEEGAPLRRVS